MEWPTEFVLLRKKFPKNQQKKEQNLAQQRFKVLSHYNLGEQVFYQEGDNIEEFPLIIWDGTRTKRFKYVCDISDGDYEKVLEIYNQEVSAPEESEIKINDGAEKILGVYAVVALILGVIAFFFCLIVAIDTEEWSLIGTGLGVFLATLVGFAFIKVFVNISYKLDKIANLLTKLENKVSSPNDGGGLWTLFLQATAVQLIQRL